MRARISNCISGFMWYVITPPLPCTSMMFSIVGVRTWISNYIPLIMWMWILIHGPKSVLHDDVIKWKHFPRYWPSVRGIHRSPVNSPHKGQWRGALMFSLIYAWINDWVTNGEAGDLRGHRAHYDVIVMGLANEYLLATKYRWVSARKT